MAATKSSGKSAGKTARLMSLDVFRGATVAFMIIVNTPGTWSHVYAPLRHAPWHGCTPTDLVFPSFLFISGVAMWFSLRKFNFEFSGASLFRILRRVLLIFAAGLFLNIFPHFIDRDYNTLRIMGVLQRIALAWGLGAVMVLLIRRNYIWLATAVILFGYWALMYFMGGADPYSLEVTLHGLSILQCWVKTIYIKDSGCLLTRRDCSVPCLQPLLCFLGSWQEAS